MQALGSAKIQAKQSQPRFRKIMSARADLQALLDRTAARAGAEQNASQDKSQDLAQRAVKLSIGEAMQELKDSSFCLVGILICLPFLIPLPVLGPLTVPGGLAIAALGWQMIRGRKAVSLPKRLAQVQLSASAWQALAGACARVMRVCERFAKPRLQHWTAGPRGERRAGMFVMLSGALLALPLVGLPFNNTLPALCAICACVALMEEDGLWFVFATFWLITLLYFAVIAYVLIYFGDKYLRTWLLQYLPHWL
jgi:hypothetical protein